MMSSTVLHYCELMMLWSVADGGSAGAPQWTMVSLSGANFLLHSYLHTILGLSSEERGPTAEGEDADEI